MRYKKLVLSLLFFFGLLSTVSAQRAEVGIDAGGAGYMGDLNVNNPLKISGISAGIFAKINFDPYWGLGLYYTYGSVKANDLSSSNADLRKRGLNFKSNLHEISILTELNFFDIYSPVAKKRFTPFIFAGIGGFIFNPKANYGGGDATLRIYRTEGPLEQYKNYAITVPYGAGAKYRLTENLTLFSKIGYRTAFTDHLDDVSGVYPAANSWRGDPPNQAAYSYFLSDPSQDPTKVGTQRGDFRKRDTYMFVSIGISYTFVSQKCFTF